MLNLLLLLFSLLAARAFNTKLSVLKHPRNVRISKHGTFNKYSRHDIALSASNGIISNALSNINKISQSLSEKFPSKAEIAKMGLNVLLSYGFVSNFSYVTSVIIAWVIHGKKTGLSALDKGQWKLFFAIYSGLWAANNIIRPLRLSLSIVISPFFESLVDTIQVKTKTKRATATGIVVFLVNFVGTLSYLFGGLYLASLAFNVKLLPS